MPLSPLAIIVDLECDQCGERGTMHIPLGVTDNLLRGFKFDPASLADIFSDVTGGVWRYYVGTNNTDRVVERVFCERCVMAWEDGYGKSRLPV